MLPSPPPARSVRWREHTRTMDATAVFEAQRQRLFGIAYRMLGSVADADDIVQDAWVRWSKVDHATIDSAPAFLTTVTSRLALDRLKSAQSRRETYVGPWLPEPLATADAESPESAAVMSESVMLGFLAVLERLGPVERAVFVLREVFDVSYGEVAQIVDRSEDNCRQIARRARDHVRAERPRVDPDPDRDRRLLDAFVLAIASGEASQLQQLLADDVVLLSDGGAAVRAARHPIIGVDRVTRFLLGLARNPQADDVSLTHAMVNGQLSLVVERPGEPTSLFALEPGASSDEVARIFVLRNPDKLDQVLPVATEGQALEF